MDYGAAVAQKGYDVKTCADRFLVYSSAFQTLKIFSASAVSTTIPTAGNTNTITITHNLGYYTPYLVVFNGSTTRGQGTSYFGEIDGDNYYYADIRQSTADLKIIVDEYFDTGTSITGDTLYFTVYIFLDDFTTFNEQNINAGTTSGSSSTDYGIRISKPGFDVKTCDDIDCIMSSSRYTNIVHKKGSVTGTSVTHNLGYIPACIAYQDNGTYITKITVGSDASNIYFSSSDTYYYIIFKNKHG